MNRPVDDRPWHSLPPEIVATLQPTLGDVADEMIEAVRTVPAYSRPLEGPFGEGIRAGVEEALRQFLAEVERGGPVPRPDVYLALGRGEMRAGRSLDSLLAAYRVGARVAWRRFAAAGVAAGFEPDTLYLLAESLFAYIDVLSAESAEGHALEQSAVASESERLRRRLVRLLVRDPPADRLAIAGDERDGVAPRLPAGTISDTIGELVCAVVPDPEGPRRRPEIERAVLEAGAQAGLGTTVEPAAAGVSFARARAALSLVQEHERPALIAAGAVAGELLLRSDPLLARELVADRLAPLQALPAGSRARLTETLGAWLAEQGRLAAVAQQLGIHPQTARYRLGRLRELFGDALDDPDERFWLELALRAR
jgi:hypothetical protein